MSDSIRRRWTLKAGALLLCATALQSGVAGAADGVERLSLPDNNPFPISRAVTVRAGTDLFFLSGQTPQPIDKSVPAAEQKFGDTEMQTMSVLTQLKGTLETLGLTMGDVVKMTVFLVGAPDTHTMDFKGFMASYSKFFGTADQPNKPARSAFQIAALGNPAYLVEIEVIAAKPPHKAGMRKSNK